MKSSAATMIPNLNQIKSNGFKSRVRKKHGNGGIGKGPVSHMGRNKRSEIAAIDKKQAHSNKDA